MLPFTPYELSVWSQEQQVIIEAKLGGMSYLSIMRICCISSSSRIQSLIERTVLGFHVKPNEMGRYALIPDIQRTVFIDRVSERADSLSCKKTSEAYTILDEIFGEYGATAISVAYSMGCSCIVQRIIDRLSTTSFSPQWLSNFCKTCGFAIKTPQKLANSRRKHCHSNVMLNFFGQLQQAGIENTCPELLFNADETASSYNSHGKVIIPDGKTPFSSEEQQWGITQ